MGFVMDDFQRSSTDGASGDETRRHKLKIPGNP